MARMALVVVVPARSGKDLIVEVPIGTVVRHDGKIRRS